MSRKNTGIFPKVLEENMYIWIYGNDTIDIIVLCGHLYIIYTIGDIKLNIEIHQMNYFTDLNLYIE